MSQALGRFPTLPLGFINHSNIDIFTVPLGFAAPLVEERDARTKNKYGATKNRRC